MIFHQSHNSMSNYNYNAFVYTDTVWDYHFHRNPELIYVIRGTVNCVVNNRAYRLTAGQFGLCLSYDIHSYQPQADTEYWVLVFSNDYVRYVSKQLAGKTGSGFPFRCRAAVEQFVLQQLVRNPSPSTLTLKSCLYAVMEEFFSQIDLIDKSTKETRIVSFVSDYVQQHHTRQLTLSDLATELGYAYNYMSRYFHSTFNMTFSDFVNIYRLETATKLLEDTDESVTAIAFKSGFQSVRAFNNFFRKTTQQSPSQYRKASRR